jgi:hypothetical protein
LGKLSPPFLSPEKGHMKRKTKVIFSHHEKKWNEMERHACCVFIIAGANEAYQ